MKPQELLEQRYGLVFPDHFFTFWEFANTHSSLLKYLGDELWGMVLTADRLMGPFECLKEPAQAQENPLWGARSYNDPPEFLTVAFGRTDGLHWGYYIDDPHSPTFPVVAYYSNDAFELTLVGDTLFEATREEVERHYDGCLELMQDDPEAKETYEQHLDQLALLREALKTYETGERGEVGKAYLAKYGKSYGNSQHVIAPTRDGMGIVVPEELYRPLRGDDICQIRNYRPTPQEIQEKAEEAMHLLAQGYPGAALKLGKDLWIYEDFRETSYAVLDAAYAALDRGLLRTWLNVAIDYRKACDAKRPV
jgi:Uncharacterised conserved protein (DUF2228)